MKIAFHKKNWDPLLSSMSKDRLGTYKVFAPNNIPHLSYAMLPYVALLEASACLFADLDMLEICLRNKIDMAICDYYKQQPSALGTPQDWFFWLPTNKRVVDAVAKAKAKAIKETKKTNISHGDIISHISFGTWILVMHELQHKDRYAWRHISNSIFPRNNNSTLPSVKFMVSEISALKDLRNRLFHHEPVWATQPVSSVNDARNNIVEIHKKTFTAIQWLSSDLFDFYQNFEKYFFEKLDKAIAITDDYQLVNSTPKGT